MHVQCVLPANTPQAGAVLYFFGGGYVEGSPNKDLAITAQLAAALGRRIYVPYYRLAPEHPAPAALGNALAVYRALLTRVPTDALAVAGEFAGGVLALSLLIEAADARFAMPAVLTLLSPWVDLSKTGDSLTLLANVAPFMNYDLTLRAAAEGYAGGQDLRSPAISPLYATLPAALPPTLITSATQTPSSATAPDSRRRCAKRVSQRSSGSGKGYGMSLNTTPAYRRAASRSTRSRPISTGIWPTDRRSTVRIDHRCSQDRAR